MRDWRFAFTGNIVAGSKSVLADCAKVTPLHAKVTLAITVPLLFAIR
jgi:hypothetical protein